MVGLRSTGESNDLTAKQILQRMKKKNLIFNGKGDKTTFQHHQLFKDTEKISEKAIIVGYGCLSDTSLGSKIPHPWREILPEDIGSCYEIMKEQTAKKVKGKIKLVRRDDRRKGGIHHTPQDLISYMVNSSLKLVDCKNPVLCDLAVGAGAFLISGVREIHEQTDIPIRDLFEHCTIGFDVDSKVLKVAAYCIHIAAGCPDLPLNIHLYSGDSLKGRNSRQRIQQKISNSFVDLDKRQLIFIGNPPYVRVKQEEYQKYGLDSHKCGNLSAYMLEQIAKLSKKGDVISQVVPISIVHSAKTISIRKILQQHCQSIEILAFDCVPGYMFDQGKIGSNSSTSITQRVAVLNSIIGEPLKSVKSSRYIRWQGEERNSLFSQTKTLVIDKKFVSEYQWPVLGEYEEKKMFSLMNKSERTIGDLVNKEGKLSLFIPDSTRYFISAVRYDLERGQKLLNFTKPSERNLAQIIINSDLFYWYWRATDGGFSVNLGGLKSIPLPSIDNQQRYEKEINNMANRLHLNAKSCEVIKENKGPKRNVKYEKKPDLMQDLNRLICQIYGFEREYYFHAHKSNNMHDFEESLRTGVRPEYD